MSEPRPRPPRAERRAPRARCAAVLPLAALAACGGGSSGSGPREADRPNVLMVVADTLRADHLGCYGMASDLTPRLDRLAEQGARFDRFVTVVSTTLASFTSILTGRYPVDHGVYRNGVERPEGLPSLPGLLFEAGYSTAGFVSSYCLGSRFGMDEGFDHYDEELPASVGLVHNKLIRRGADTTDAVLAWLDRQGGERPWFVMVHYFDPHWPYAPPPPFDATVDSGTGSSATGAYPEVLAARRRFHAAGEPDSDAIRLHELHQGEIRYMDHHVGRLLDGVEERSARPTFVVMTADHGESIFEHDDPFNHGLSVYDTNIRVPLIVRGPGVAHRVVSTRHATIDLLPTVLELADVVAPDGLPGRSVVPVLAAGADELRAEPRLLFAEATKPAHVEYGQTWPNARKARCVMLGALKLIWTPWQGDRQEMYHVGADPAERDDLLLRAAGPGTEDVEWLQAELTAWSSRKPRREAGQPPELDPEVARRLRSLGYVK